MLPWLARTSTSSAAFWAGDTSTMWSTPFGASERDLGREVGIRILHDVMRARRARQFGLLVAAHGGDDGRARPHRELDRRVSDGARAALHQHDATVECAGREPRRPELVHGECAVRRHRGHAEAGGDVERDAVGQPHGAARGYDRELLRRAGRALVSGEEEPHAVADLQIGDVRADRVDDAGAVLVRHDLVELRAACRPRGPSSPSG